MSAGYQQPEVTFEGRQATIRCRLENRSGEAWTSRNGLAVGCQILDRVSGTYVGEGQWIGLPADVPPGSAITIDVCAELPDERGSYRLIVSPVDEKLGWRYRHGWPALVVDVDYAAGLSKVVETRIATGRRLRLELLPRTIGRALQYPLETVWRNWGLIRSMVRRDILARYRGSLGDVLWTILNPLLLMSTYFFVFGVVLQARFAGDPSKSGFALYFLAGMLPWLAVTEAVGRSAMVVVEHRNFVKKLLFPVEILPVNLVISGLVTELFALLVFMAGLLLIRGAVPVTVLWLPVLLVPQILLTVGLCWFLAGLGVYMRDLGQIIGFVLTLWFFLTPICYPESQLPAALVPYLEKNPLYRLVQAYRMIFLEARAPHGIVVLKLYLIGAAVCLAGHAWFYKLRRSFADVI